MCSYNDVKKDWYYVTLVVSIKQCSTVVLFADMRLYKTWKVHSLYLILNASNVCAQKISPSTPDALLTLQFSCIESVSFCFTDSSYDGYANHMLLQYKGAQVCFVLNSFKHVTIATERLALYPHEVRCSRRDV